MPNPKHAPRIDGNQPGKKKKHYYGTIPPGRMLGHNGSNAAKNTQIFWLKKMHWHLSEPQHACLHEK